MFVTQYLLLIPLSCSILKKCPFAIMSLLFIVSCQSTRKFETKEISRLCIVYKTNFTPASERSPETRKQIKNRLEQLERYMALSPDSIVISQESGESADKAVVDSFYSNINKISYIQRHKLESAHKIFY